MKIYVYLYTYMYIYPRLTINTEHQSNGILVVIVHPVYRERGCISMGRCSDRQWGDYASCVFLSSTKHIKKVSNTKKRKIISKYKKPLPIVICSRQSQESNVAKQQAIFRGCNVVRSGRPSNIEFGFGFEPQTMHAVMLTVHIIKMEFYPMPLRTNVDSFFQWNV